MSCAEWVERGYGLTLTEFQKKAVEILADAFNTGVYNLPINWKKVQWQWGTGVRFCISRGICTWDFDHMTRLVIAAHDECVRVEVSGAARGYLYIEVHPRKGREGEMHNRHPTIEQAIAKFRRQEGLAEPRAEAAVA